MKWVSLFTSRDLDIKLTCHRYENISKLITMLERTFESQGFLWVSEKTTLSEQRGVFRVNCIDCLDRTNVVQVCDPML